MGITRRSFVEAAAASATLGVAASGVATAGEASWEPRWTDEADLVIVGYGAAGTVAAIAGVDAGASVLVLEKAPAREGGNLACSGGNLHEVVPDIDEWYAMYLHGSYGVAANEAIAKTYAENANSMPEWFDDHDIPTIWPKLTGDGFKTPSSYLQGNIDDPDGTSGIHMFRAFDAAANERGVEVRLSTAGKRLIKNPVTNEVVGVLAEGPNGEELTFKAKKAVLLCCGGYENNPEIQYNHFMPGIRFFPMGTPYNTGDGITMATEMGAKLWHMGLIEYHNEMLRVPSEIANIGIRLCPTTSGSYIYVDAHGKRYCNEKRLIVHRHPHIADFDYDDDTYDFAHRPMFAIFDQTMYDEVNPLWNKSSKPGSSSAGYVYSAIELTGNPDFHLEWPDNEYAIEQGWLFKGETLEELAANIRSEGACAGMGHAVEGIDADALAATVEDWNSFCEAGEDAEFGRKAETLGALTNPPFYAIELANGVMNTNGGPVRNEYSQTMNSYGEPIARLYSCGELGSFNGIVYNVGNLMEAVVTGRIAAEHAAQLTAWDV